MAFSPLREGLIWKIGVSGDDTLSVFPARPNVDVEAVVLSSEESSVRRQHPLSCRAEICVENARQPASHAAPQQSALSALVFALTQVLVFALVLALTQVLVFVLVIAPA
jgi:hypothetical protein